MNISADLNEQTVTKVPTLSLNKPGEIPNKPVQETQKGFPRAEPQPALVLKNKDTPQLSSTKDNRYLSIYKVEKTNKLLLRKTPPQHKPNPSFPVVN